jgi:hypothetical protein
MRHDAQFDLRVVGSNDFITLIRNKCLTDPAPFFTADRNILQIGLGAAQAACGSQNLVKGRMDAAIGRIDRLAQAFDKGRT